LRIADPAVIAAQALQIVATAMTVVVMTKAAAIALTPGAAMTAEMTPEVEEAAAIAAPVAAAAAAIDILSNEKTCREFLCKSFLILPCKMSENGVQLASTFVLYKTLFF
jgi:hypothetical protein